MTYLQQFHPWCIIRPSPNMRTLKQIMPSVRFEIVFDVMPDSPND
jgi:hypothetical protein